VCLISINETQGLNPRSQAWISQTGAKPKRVRLSPRALTTITELAFVDEHDCLVSSSATGLMKISNSPLAFADDNFLDTSECAELIAFAKARADPGETYDVQIPPEQSEVMASIMRRVSVLCGSAPHPGEPTPVVRNTPPNRELEGGRWMNRGLHLDTNGNPFRCATILVYLSDVSIDGATVFPCGGNTAQPSTREAGAALARKGITAVIPGRQRGDQEAGALEKTLIAAAASFEGFSVYPKAGRLLLFYPLLDDGGADPYSWHGGAAVGNGPGDGKWLLQIFKTVPNDSRSKSDLAAFMNHRRAMHQ